MLTELLTRPITITHRPDPADDGPTDPYGNPETEPQTTETVGELQQRQRSETGDQGELSDTSWLLILPAGTAIATADTVTVDDIDYELVGDPWTVHDPFAGGAASHIEATCRRTA